MKVSEAKKAEVEKKTGRFYRNATEVTEVGSKRKAPNFYTEIAEKRGLRNQQG